MSGTSYIADDEDGGRLHAAWSRSGKRLIVSVTTPNYHPIAQAALDRAGVAALGQLVADQGAGDITVEDAAEGAELRASWKRSGTRLVIAASPRLRRHHERPWEGDWRDDALTVWLERDQAAALAGFLSA